MVVSAPGFNCCSPLKTSLFSRRDNIPLQEDILWQIERGVVRTLSLNEEGTLITLGYWGAEDVVGQPLSRIVPYQIECMTNVEVSRLPKELWGQRLDAIVKHVQQAEELLRIAHQHPVLLRLWKLLVWLGEKFGRNVEGGRLIDLRMTHQELAEAINSTRVTVTRLLQQFESEGKLRRHQRRLVLVSADGSTGGR